MSAAIIHLDKFRRDRSSSSAPEWSENINHCCAYANLLKAEHAHEQALIRFEIVRDHEGCAWWEVPGDFRSRVETNNLLWNTYIALLVHIASLSAGTRREAAMKRATIGKMWLRPDGSSGPFAKMRNGCLADDYLFPPSSRLERVKGAVRLS